jgi:hypothetical protein
MQPYDMGHAIKQVSLRLKYFEASLHAERECLIAEASIWHASCLARTDWAG